MVFSSPQHRYCQKPSISPATVLPCAAPALAGCPRRMPCSVANSGFVRVHPLAAPGALLGQNSPQTPDLRKPRNIAVAMRNWITPITAWRTMYQVGSSVER